MKNLFKLLVVLAASIGLMTTNAPDAQAALFGCDWDGNLYSVNTADASLGLIGNTGLPFLGALEFAPTGRLYGFTASASGGSALYTIDPTNANATLIGNLGFSFVSEGGLAFSPGGAAYGVTEQGIGGQYLFSLDLTSGAATTIGLMAGDFYDVNGLLWRNDGMLVGIDEATSALVTIDPTTAAVAALAPLGFSGGAIGGMSTDYSTGISYFATGISSDIDGFPGTNGLYNFNPANGVHGAAPIGNFAAPSLASAGISGLAGTPSAPIPEPGTMMLLGTGLAGVAVLRRKFKR